MNTHVRDNENYLYGAAGAIALQNSVQMNNGVAFTALDSGAVARTLLLMTAGNIVSMDAGANGWRVLNQAETITLASLDTSGNLTLSGARVAFASPYRAHRHPYANDRHIESGLVTTSAAADVAVTFNTAFAGTPNVTSTAHDGSAASHAPMTNTVSTTGFNISCYTAANAREAVGVAWEAEGN